MFGVDIGFTITILMELMTGYVVMGCCRFSVDRLVEGLSI